MRGLHRMSDLHSCLHDVDQTLPRMGRVTANHKQASSAALAALAIVTTSHCTLSHLGLSKSHSLIHENSFSGFSE